MTAETPPPTQALTPTLTSVPDPTPGQLMLANQVAMTEALLMLLHGGPTAAGAEIIWQIRNYTGRELSGFVQLENGTDAQLEEVIEAWASFFDVPIKRDRGRSKQHEFITLEMTATMLPEPSYVFADRWLDGGPPVRVEIWTHIEKRPLEPPRDLP